MKAMVSLLRHTQKWTPESERGKHEVTHEVKASLLREALYTPTQIMHVCVRVPDAQC